MSIISNIYPSILAADLGYVAEVVQELNRYPFAGLHVDVMDGHFVPEISFGAAMVETIARHSDHPIGVHLMVNKPLTMLERMVDLGASRLAFHREIVPSPTHHAAYLSTINAELEIAINPSTQFRLIEPYLDLFSGVLLMSVVPGRCGQSYIESSSEKIAVVKKELVSMSKTMALTVDGGIDRDTLKLAQRAGADRFVVGSSLLGTGLTGIDAAVERLCGR